MGKSPFPILNFEMLYRNRTFSGVGFGTKNDFGVSSFFKFSDIDLIGLGLSVRFL